MLIFFCVCRHNCSLCEAMYVGSTSRTLCIWTVEHKGMSSRTRRHIAVPHSALRLHTEGIHDAPVRSEVLLAILYSSNNPVSLRILESFYIHKMEPKLN